MAILGEECRSGGELSSVTPCGKHEGDKVREEVERERGNEVQIQTSVFVGTTGGQMNIYGLHAPNTNETRYMKPHQSGQRRLDPYQLYSRVFIRKDVISYFQQHCGKECLPCEMTFFSALKVITNLLTSKLEVSRLILARSYLGS